jgi:CheY-like chemotaxis protein
MEKALYNIHNSGVLLMGLINDILDLSKIEAGKMELQPAKYEIANLLNDIINLNIIRIGNKPIEFQLSVDENLPTILIGDDIRIKQIMNNLLSNAFKYTDKGIVKLSVSFETTDEGIKHEATVQPMSSSNPNVIIIFKVSDTGQGMTKEQIDKLFNNDYVRFNMEANRSTEGTGLGMSITNNLVTLMNGSISVEGTMGKGTTFTVRLLQETVGSCLLGKELAESLEKLETNVTKLLDGSQIIIEPMPYGSVLIMDDVGLNLYVAEGTMEPYKLSIETAMSGKEAIKKIEDGKVYDIVFMDHIMPGMDGIESTKRIRELGYTKPIVALTANAVVGQSDIFLTNGFDGFISKPIDVQQLNSILLKFVRDKQPPEVIEVANRQQADQGG